MTVRGAGKLAVLIALLALPRVGAAENWPQWRGPAGNGTSPERNLPVRWSTTENVVWKLALPGVSGATPIIWEDRIFLNVGSGVDLELWAVDRQSGELLWQRRLGGENRVTRKQNMSSPSPVTDGTHVWVLTGTGVVKAFDFDGTELWAREIEEDYGPFGLNWGYASSPLLLDDRLIVQVLHGMRTDDPSYVLAIDSATGETLWRVERPTDAKMESPDAYTTPLLVETSAGPEVVVSGGNYVTGHDPETGAEVWRAGGLNPQDLPMYRVVASPVVSGNLIYVPTRVKPMLAFRTGGSGDITESHRAFEMDGPDVPTPTTDGDRLYILGDRGELTAFAASNGELLWSERVAAGTYSASPLLADGRIYATNEAGVTTVARVMPTFEVEAENDLEGYTLASIAVSDGQFFLRTEAFLYCISASTQ